MTQELDSPDPLRDEIAALRRQVADLEARELEYQHELAECQRIEEALRESEARNRALLAGIPDLMFILNSKGVFLDYHIANEEALLVPPAQFMGKNMAEVLPPRLVTELSRSFETTRYKGSTEEIEYFLDIPSGRRYFDARVTAFGRDKLLVIIRDITQRRETEENLRTTHATLQALIQAAPLAIILLDATGRVIIWNPAAERLFGWTAEEVLGQLTPIIPQDKKSEFLELHGRALAGETITTLEVRRQRKDGVLIEISLSTAPLYNAEGQIIGGIGIFTDITERKQVEAEREALIAELQAALVRVRRLKDLLPICASCKRIRNDQGYWEQIEVYFSEHAEIDFTSGICPECKAKLYPKEDYPYLYDEEPLT